MSVRSHRVGARQGVRPISSWLFGAVLLLMATCVPAAERHALLIGVGDYQDSRVQDLQGPQADIEAMKKALIDHWAFEERNIRTLVDRQATRAHIMQELDALATRSKAGDQVFVYFSGHGTSSEDGTFGHQLKLPHTSGALVPADFPAQKNLQAQIANIIVGRRDLLPLFKQLDRTGRRVFVAFDACYSGHSVRGLYRSAFSPPVLTRRYLRLATPEASRSASGDDDELAACFDCGTRDPAPPYPYENIVYLSAASDSETAADIGYGLVNQPGYKTLDGRPHGAFTDALLRVLAGRQQADGNGDGRIEYGELYAAVKRFMENRPYGHEPQLLPQLKEDDTGLTRRSLFGDGGIPVSGYGSDLPTALTLRVQLAEGNSGLRQALENIAGLKLVDGDPQLIIMRDDAGLMILNPSGDLVGRLASEAEVLRRLQQELWLRRFTQPSQQSFGLRISLKESVWGSTAKRGEYITLSLKSEQKAYLLVLDLFPDGELHVLYPYRAQELRLLPGGRLLTVPGERCEDMIQVTEPFGTDYVVAFAFSNGRGPLPELMGEQIAWGSSLQQRLESWLKRQQGNYAHAALQLKTVPSDDPTGLSKEQGICPSN